MRRQKIAAPVTKIETDFVWGAGVAAYRVNNHKFYSLHESASINDKIAFGHLEASEAVVPNLTIIRGILDGTNADVVTQEDIEAGRELRKYFQTWVFRVIKGVLLSEFQKNFLNMSDFDEWDSGMTQYFNYLAYAPELAIKEQAEDRRNNRISGCTGTVGNVGDRVELNIEVLYTRYSPQWNRYYFTAVTETNKVVRFSKDKKFMEEDCEYKISARVKMHDNQTGITRLNYVKLIGVTNE